MDAKTKIIQYRERLDRTLACRDLTDESTIKTNVESRLLQSPGPPLTKGDVATLLEKRTNELVDFLGMLRSAALNDDRNTNTSPSGLLDAEWKVKQDTEECRVMYREGPPGTPFHVLLVEGYLDGPVDACLCVAWETTLYKKWWPQFNYPAFKVTSSQCIHEIGTGEKICTVRMKVPWPLSAREALLHFYEFEFFQEDLVIVIIKTIDDVERDGSLYGITNESIPESNNVVRIGVVGGLAIQRVNHNRCYFRFIASLDMKLDFVSPSLINFIARQLIGNGFKLCQKAVASISKGSKDFSEALEGPMYNRIRLAGYLPETVEITEPEIIKESEGDDTEGDVIESTVDKSTTNIPLNSHNEKTSDVVLNGVSEIKEDENEQKAVQFPAFKVAKTCTGMYEKKMQLRPAVEHALGTLDRVIEAVRERRKDKAISSNALQRVLEAAQVHPKFIETDAYELAIPIVDSNVDHGAHDCSAENPKVSKGKIPKTSCFCWTCNPGGHRHQKTVSKNAQKPTE